MSFINHLREYKFLDYTASVAKEQIAAAQKPCATWGDFGSRWSDSVWYNGKSILAVGADVASYMFVCSLRKIGLCLPLPPMPPEFPIPHDGAEFIDNAIQRALWNWDVALREEMEEGISDGLSDKWNIYQTILEWSVAYSFEHVNFSKVAEKDKAFLPKFLTCSEPLADRTTFVGIGQMFGKLSLKERKLILGMLYRQEALPEMSAFAKKVYRDMRAFASLQQQGNKNYFEALTDYQKQRADGTLRKLVTNAPEPTVAEKVEQVYTARVPSAPMMPVHVEPGLDRGFLQKVVGPLNHQSKEQIRKDRAPPLMNGNHPEVLLACLPDASWKYFVARLATLQLLKGGWNPTGFLSEHEKIKNGKTFQQVKLGFDRLQDADYQRLQKAIESPTTHGVTGSLRDKWLELSELSDILHRKEVFLKTYEAMRAQL